MRIIVASIFALFAVVACSSTNMSMSDMAFWKSDKEQPESLSAWLDEQYEIELQFSPIQLTFLGRKDQNNSLGEFNVQAFKQVAKWKRSSVKQMEKLFDYESLSPEDKISYDVWKYQSKQDSAGMPFIYNGFTFDQMNGAQGFIPTFLINFHKVDDKADMEAYISRIIDVEPRMNELVEIAREASDRGVVMPDFAIEGVVKQSKAIITGQPFDGEDNDSDIWADVKMEIANLLESEKIDESEADELRMNAMYALTNHFMPAYNNIIDWANGERSKSPAVNSGVASQPNGKAYYKYRIANQTTTSLTADEIHEIGLAEVARIRGEMEAIKRSVGFEGSLKDFFTELREDKDNNRYYYSNTDSGRKAYIDDATEAIDRIKAELPNFFGILPKADLIVKRVEPFRERDGAAQHYYSGTPDGSRPGIYYAHLSDMKAMPKRELEVIAYHEGLPGHHMQISIAQELEGVPQFRTQAGFTAYTEGWALYSEKLATEIPGTFRDPYSDFGRLGSEIWRAIRLVVDTGLHAKGWTEDEAVDYFLDNAAITEAQARSEVQRYIVMPGQALAYKIGMIRIQDLRAKAEKALGRKFDIRNFHDIVLSGGAMPLDVLERRVDNWIEKTQRTAVIR